MCLNDGSGTRFNSRTGISAGLDLTLVSSELANVCVWEVRGDSTFGSDHLPVLCSLLGRRRGGCKEARDRWVFSKAKWDMFYDLCESSFKNWGPVGSIDEETNRVTQELLSAAEECVPRSKGGRTKRVVPWWSEECRAAIKERNRALNRARRSQSIADLIAYRMARAHARRVIRQAKRLSWRNFCSSIGRTTPLSKVWSRVKYMDGIPRDPEIPVLSKLGREAVSEIDRAEMIAQTLVKVHSSDNLTDEEKRGRSKTAGEFRDFLIGRGVSDSSLDCSFTRGELRRAIGKTKDAAPGRDRICYIMLRNLGKFALDKLLGLYNSIWTCGHVPEIWKEAVIVPVRKPGKDPTDPGNYRPIALTSHLCKIMERMVVDRLTYFLESRGLLSKFQSGFRHSRGTMDPVVCLDSDVRKAQVNREVVLAVFFDVEKAYDMVWIEGVLIRLRLLGVGGKMFCWIKDFLEGRSIQVRVGSVLSRRYLVENGTPQGSVISPIIFSIAINAVFDKVPLDIGRSLFADDGALWKRGRNGVYVAKKMQEALGTVEEWAKAWGFRFSVGKTKSMLFFEKQNRRREGVSVRSQNLVPSLTLYGQVIES